MKNWFTGSGEEVSINDIVYQIKEHSFMNGTTYIGTDSFFKKRECNFSTAICLYGADDQRGGRYFFQKSKVPKKYFPNLSIRMIREAEKTIDIAKLIIKKCSFAKLELHLDISEANKQEGTSKFTNMLVGYVKGSGFDCKVKPHAFAAASIADKHSK